MEIGAICGLLLIAALLAVTLRSTRPELALALGLAAGIIASLTVLSALSGAIDTVKTLLEQAGIAGDTALLLIKALGICLLTQLTADVCRDAGESGLASRAELAGKVALLLLALPLFRQILSLALTLMGSGE